MPEETTFAQYLKENTTELHDTVDQSVMAAKPFDNPANYVKFLQLQAIFHKIVDDIYKDPKLAPHFKDLPELARYEDVLKDLHDLNAAEHPLNTPLPQPQGAEALGWLYCAEGSNVGAAFLFKDAQNKLGYTADHGAGHLAPHADGRGKHWREFVDYLNRVPLNGAEQEAALQGAQDAFRFYHKLIGEIYA